MTDLRLLTVVEELLGCMEIASSDVASQLSFAKKANNLWHFRKPENVVSGFDQPQESQAEISFSSKMNHLNFLQMGIPQTGSTSQTLCASIYQEIIMGGSVKQESDNEKKIMPSLDTRDGAVNYLREKGLTSAGTLHS